ncbi:MAG: 2'-5' RNA ligase family protein [Defluviitaleaceae bacterium]|nr:2'-5' RNA ligase family protein [Defluviitaleaceae bacterium]
MLKKRTVMIFPKFENMKLIDELRQKYDPLVDKVQPHITLVFPFESNLVDSEIYKILDNRLNKIKPFEICVYGLSVTDCWLFLNITKGTDILYKIHDILYENEFVKYKPLWLNTYTPHMTVGKFNSIEETKRAYEYEKSFEHTFSSMIDKVSVEIIGEEDESIIEVEYSLF